MDQSHYSVGETYQLMMPGRQIVSAKIYKIAEIKDVRYVYVRYYLLDVFAFLQGERIPEDKFDGYVHDFLMSNENLAIV